MRYTMRRVHRPATPPVDYDTFCEWAGEIVDSVPERILDELNGGVQVDREARRNPDDPPGVYLLGEYIVEPYVGRLVRLYYGSFTRLFRREAAAYWRRELEVTIVHELRHHVEDLAGVDDLVDEDIRDYFRMKREAEGEG